MPLVLVLVLIVLIFGGVSFPDYRGPASGLGIVLLILLIWVLLGGGGHSLR